MLNNTLTCDPGKVKSTKSTNLGSPKGQDIVTILLSGNGLGKLSPSGSEEKEWDHSTLGDTYARKSRAKLHESTSAWNSFCCR